MANECNEAVYCDEMRSAVNADLIRMIGTTYREFDSHVIVNRRENGNISVVPIHYCPFCGFPG